MVIDCQTFTEFAVHLRIASDDIVKTAQHLATISAPTSAVAEEVAWGGTIDSMLSLSTQLRVLDRLLYAVLDANDDGTHGSEEPPLVC
jgi:hypothetical protein